MPRVIVVGGGISGLSTCYYLAKAGIPSTIIESRPRLGGVIQTEHVDGCVIEAGPDSFLSLKPAAMELIRELGMESEVIGSNDHIRKTFVWKNGRQIPLPDGLMMMVPTEVMPLLTTPLLSWTTKLRMGFEVLRAPGPKPADESVAEFVEEHYGREAVDYLAEPLLSGIYGGSPEVLSVRSVLPRFVELAEKYGSLSKGVLAERKKAPKQSAPLFRTLKNGLQEMTDAIVRAASPDVINGRAEAIERSERYRVRVNGDWIECDHLVLACEAHSAAKLVPEGRIAELLARVPYSSSMTVALGFRAAEMPPPDGFGFLVPKKERKRVVACTWIGTKFPNRVPEGFVVARCFLGGMEDPGILDETDDAVIAATLDELGRIAGVRAKPIFTRVFRWPRSMAQYTVGHQLRLAEIDRRVTATPGLHLAGNAYSGIGIPDCIRTGKQAAERIAAAWQSS